MRELASRFAVSVKTLRADMQHLAGMGLLERHPVNRRMTGYTQAGGMEEKLKAICRPGPYGQP